mmetsp:Transcript_28677/g.78851  ORF Transcript_28677/g.78851 Transcript_28677/m.78851 type:complete len:139 (-) Transcript_28677:1657-2073(-)
MPTASRRSTALSAYALEIVELEPSSAPPFAFCGAASVPVGPDSVAYAKRRRQFWFIDPPRRRSFPQRWLHFAAPLRLLARHSQSNWGFRVSLCHHVNASPRVADSLGLFFDPLERCVDAHLQQLDTIGVTAPSFVRNK